MRRNKDGGDKQTGWGQKKMEGEEITGLGQMKSVKMNKQITTYRLGTVVGLVEESTAVLHRRLILVYDTAR